MSTKNNPGTYNCYAKAKNDEPMFILLARDPLAPELVRKWAYLRKISGECSNKVLEAEECAQLMEKWRRMNPMENKP